MIINFRTHVNKKKYLLKQYDQVVQLKIKRNMV